MEDKDYCECCPDKCNIFVSLSLLIGGMVFGGLIVFIIMH